MRISRMLEMIYLLLEKRHSTARELADKFNVSTKTIYRDVEDLIKAGVPIYMQKGVNGGIVLNEKYAINKTKLTASETESLIKALEDIKKLPNAKLDYALRMMKQYFNEAATLWVNTDDISLNMQDKFHHLKIATIERHIIEFQYFTGKEFIKYRVEPYELRIKEYIWKLLIRDIKAKKFEEVYISRMMDIEVKDKQFTRMEIPDEFGKKHRSDTKDIIFKVQELTDEILNRFPVESFDFTKEGVYLKLKVKRAEDGNKILKQFIGMKIVKQNK